MEKIINGSEIANIFSIFHDGGISAYSFENDLLRLEIGIDYLAELINPMFMLFFVELDGVRDISFLTWPNDRAIEGEKLTDLEAIFKPEPGILEGDVQDGMIQIYCDTNSKRFEYYGGKLKFSAESAKVTDENGKHYRNDELSKLAQSYWGDE